LVLDLRRLWILREVARAGSLSGAADALSYSQPAVSKQVALLEREVGLPLIHRTSRGVRLTEAGRQLVSHTDDILARLTAAERALHEFADLQTGTVRLGAFPTAFVALVPEALRAFRRAASGVEVDIRVVEPEAALDDLRRGDLDLALVYDHALAPLPRTPALERHQLLEDPMLAALPADHPLGGQKQLALTDLRDDRWIQGTSGPTARLVEHACLVAGFAPRIAVETGDALTAQGLVAAGTGITLLPSLALPTVRSDLLVRPLSAPPSRRVYSVTGAFNLAPATATMRGCIDEAAGHLARVRGCGERSHASPTIR
jgi:DNA-binding transcriptional LysR family regulator